MVVKPLIVVLALIFALPLIFVLPFTNPLTVKLPPITVLPPMPTPPKTTNAPLLYAVLCVVFVIKTVLVVSIGVVTKPPFQIAVDGVLLYEYPDIVEFPKIVLWKLVVTLVLLPVAHNVILPLVMLLVNVETGCELILLITSYSA